MKILEEAEELKKQLEALETEEGDGLPEEIVEEVVEEPEVKDEPVDEPKEEPKEEVKDEPEELDASGWRKLRREKAAAEKRAQEAESKLAAPKEETESNPLDAEIADVIIERRKQKAEQEFNRLEQDFARTVPGYEDTEDAVGVATQYKMAIYNSIRTAHPRMSHSDILDQTKETLLKKAGTYLNQGFDPIEEMYQDAVALGIKPQPRKVQEEVKEEIKKPDLSKVAANKARNAGTAGARGSAGEAKPTLDFVAQGDVKEWLKQTPEQKREYLAQLKALAG